MKVATSTETQCLDKRASDSRTHLAPHQHGAEHHLQAVEEVVPDEDDSGTAGGPALARTDGFDAGRGCFGNT